MVSKVLIVTSLLLAVAFLMMSSEVAARALTTETSSGFEKSQVHEAAAANEEKASAESEDNLGAADFVRGCNNGCCGFIRSRCVRCCQYAGELADVEIHEPQPDHN